MKKIISVILSFLGRTAMTLLVATVAVSAWAVEVGDIITLGGIKYKISQECKYDPETQETYGRAYVIGYDESYPYTNIEIDAFLRLDNNPYYVESIIERSLCGWKEMTSLKIWCTTGTIQRGVGTIGPLAFEGCTGLTTIDISNRVVIIHQRAFEGCTSLTTIDIPNSVLDIDDGAFAFCTSLRSVKFSEGVMSINNSVFQGCTSLKSFNIPNNVKSIGGYAFKDCTSLTSIDIPNSVKSIGACAFEGCTSLSDIYFDGTETQWGNVTKRNYWKPSATKEHWRCAVTFDANGHGSAPNAQTNLWSNKSRAEEPESLTASGFVFTGWYTDTDCTSKWNFSTPVPRDMTLYAGWEKDLQLSDNTATNLSDYDGQKLSVTLKGRTLYKDGSWNTLCLPFTVSDGDASDGISFTGTPLEGAIVKTLNSSSFAAGTLTLNFSDDLTGISAGTPCIVRWERAGDYIDDNEHNTYEPVFSGVIINKELHPVDQVAVDFMGGFSPVSLAAGDRSVLYLDANNSLNYPNAAMTIGSCHAYFQLADGLLNPDLGDVNGDGLVSVTDVMALVNYILGNTVSNFVVENADANGDEAITVTDVMVLVKIVLQGSQHSFNVVVNGADGITFGGGGTNPARVGKNH